MRSVVWTLFAVAIVIASVGCKKNKTGAGDNTGGQGAASKAVQTPPPAAAGGQAPTAPAGGLGTGKVLETMNTAGYTYVRVDLNGTELWAAGPETPVKVGDTVTLPDGAPMENYESKTLGRTFERVYFVQAIITPGSAGGQMGGMGGMGGMAGTPPTSGGAAAATPPAEKITDIKVAEGGHKVEDLFAKKAELAGKEVLVRGKVVKFSAGIMGRNWLHLQDGSGAAGTSDLTVTTDASAAVGDTVLIKGVVAVDKDFGAGYRYDVIVEGATVTVE